MLQLHGGFRVRVKVSVRVLFRQTFDEWMGPKVHFFAINANPITLFVFLSFKLLNNSFNPNASFKPAYPRRVVEDKVFSKIMGTLIKELSMSKPFLNDRSYF